MIFFNFFILVYPKWWVVEATWFLQFGGWIWSWVYIGPNPYENIEVLHCVLVKYQNWTYFILYINVLICYFIYYHISWEKKKGKSSMIVILYKDRKNKKIIFRIPIMFLEYFLILSKTSLIGICFANNKWQILVCLHFAIWFEKYLNKLEVCYKMK